MFGWPSMPRFPSSIDYGQDEIRRYVRAIPGTMWFENSEGGLASEVGDVRVNERWHEAFLLDQPQESIMSNTPDVTINSFAVGAVVQFKSGGQKMTVSGLQGSPSHGKNWFERDHGKEPVATSAATVELIWTDSVGVPHMAAVNADVLQKAE